jgi:release factor glutamine methyltransferase
METSGNNDLPEEYKMGYADFLGCKIDLSMRPLIPRPETEFWTRRAIIDLAQLKQKDVRVLDIFSGSGCVGIAVAKHIEKAHADLCDINLRAVEQIKINLNLNKIAPERAAVFESDIFAGIPPVNRYDAILANPPYVDPARKDEVQRSVLNYEPSAALFGGNKGLETIEKFFKSAKSYLKENGFIYLEFDSRQRGDIMEIIKKEGYSSFKFFKDQFGLWRFVKIIK